MNVSSALKQLAFILRAVADDVSDISEREDVASGELVKTLAQISEAAGRLERLALDPEAAGLERLSERRSLRR